MDNKNINPQESITKQGRFFFYMCLGLCLVMVFLLWRPFIKTIVLAMICAAVLYPVYTRLVMIFKGRKALASMSTCILLIFLVIIPLTMLIFFLGQEATNFYSKISSLVQQGFSLAPQTGIIVKSLDMLHQYFPAIHITPADMEAHIINILKLFINFLMENSSSVIGNITNMILQFFLLIFALFYFLRDGAELFDDFSFVIPLPESQKMQVLSMFKDVSKTTVVGILLTALIQGIIAGIGFLIAGISPVLWGTTAAFASLIPMAGTALVWVPAGIVLLTHGSIWQGIFLFFWGAIFVSSSDTLIRTYLMKGATEVSPLWILFSILGGLNLFGFTGLLIGPILLSLCITLIMIYKDAYADQHKELP